MMPDGIGRLQLISCGSYFCCSDLTYLVSLATRRRVSEACWCSMVKLCLRFARPAFSPSLACLRSGTLELVLRPAMCVGPASPNSK